MDRRDLLILVASLALGGAVMTPAPVQAAASAALAGFVVPPPRRPGAYVAAKDGTRLHCRDWGAGAPVVFVHSWALDARMWDYQIAFLGERGHRCIAYDRRGHGRSDMAPGGYDADTLADDLAAVIEAHDLHGVTLVAHSMGGGEVVRYLARHGSARVGRIVLLAPTLPFILKTPDNPEGIDGAMIEAVRDIWRQDFPHWIAANQRPFVTGETSAAMIEWLTLMMYGCPLPVALACNRTLVETDFRPDCGRVDVPALLIHGDRDASAPLPVTGARAAALIPGCDFRLYEGAPHGLFVTHMERVNADILGFIGG